MEKILLLGDGSLLKGILIMPFAVNGLILMLRGAVANLERLEEKHPKIKDWRASAYFASLILSYVALFYAAAKIL